MPYTCAFDLEGVFTPNDAAYETTEIVINDANVGIDGGKWYEKVSSIDDYFAEVAKLSNYDSGYTIKLVLPFLKSLDATQESLREVYKRIIRHYPGAIWAGKDMQHQLWMSKVYIVTTSWHEFVKEVTQTMHVNPDNIFATVMNIDKPEYHLSADDKSQILKWMKEIDGIEVIDVEGIGSINEFPKKVQEYCELADNIIWNKLAKIPGVKNMFEDIHVVDATGKENALKEITEREDIEFKNLYTKGDSSTDVKMLNKTRKRGGISTAFVGKEPPLRVSDFSLTAENCYIFVPLVAIANEGGKDELKSLARDWSLYNLVNSVDSNIKDKELASLITDRMHTLYNIAGLQFPKYVYLPDLSQEEKHDLVQENAGIRKKLRGAAIASIR